MSENKQPRADRFSISGDEEFFKVFHGKEELSVLNVSSSGIAVKPFAMGSTQEWTLELVFPDQKVRALAKPVRVNDQLVALHFAIVEPPLEPLLLRHFQIEKRAKGLHPIDPKYMSAEKFSKGESFWYRSTNGDEILFSREGERIVYFQARIMKLGIDYHMKSGVKFFKFNKADKSYAPWVPEPADADSSRSLFERFVKSVDLLNEVDRAALVGIIRQ